MLTISGAALFPESVYSDITPQTATLPKVLMFATADSCISDPTLSKYMSIPPGKYLFDSKSVGKLPHEFCDGTEGLDS